MRVSEYRLITIVVVLLLAGSAVAQEDRTEQALSRAQALLRQVSAEKQELEVANARLAGELAAAEQRLARIEAGLRETRLDLESEQRRAARSGDELQQTRARLERTEETLREAAERLRATSEELNITLDERDRLDRELVAVKSELADSERKNLELYLANVELLEMYRDKGPLTALLQAEPVTGLRSVRIENILQEYRHKLEDLLRDGNREAARRAEQHDE